MPTGKWSFQRRSVEIALQHKYCWNSWKLIQLTGVSLCLVCWFMSWALGSFVLCTFTQLPSNTFASWVFWNVSLRSHGDFLRCNKVWHYWTTWVCKNCLSGEEWNLGVAEILMGTWRRVLDCSRGQERGVMDSANPEKKMPKRRRWYPIWKSRELDLMQTEKCNWTRTLTAQLGVWGRRFWPISCRNKCDESDYSTSGSCK